MRAEHLRRWLIAAAQDDLPDATNWLKVVSIVNTELCDGTLAEKYTWHTVVLIPKERGGFWWIGLVEVLWKAVASLLSLRITPAIKYQDFIHGFRAGRGAGTAALEARMLQ